MKRLAILVVALALLAAACSSADTKPDVSEPEASPTTTIVKVVENAALEDYPDTDYPEAKICSDVGNIDFAARGRLEKNLKGLVSEVNDEVVLVSVYLGTLYLPGQKTGNKENYSPISFSDFITCDKKIAVFTVTVLGEVNGGDWLLTRDRWSRAIYEIATRIRSDERFNEIEQVGIRTIWASDSSTMDGIMEMSDIRQIADSASAGSYFQILLRNNWLMDVHERYPRDPKD